jgi:hypothetical protein
MTIRRKSIFTSSVMLIALIFIAQSVMPTSLLANSTWRSELYPTNWYPGFSVDGKFLHDFSYAGYKRGEEAIPTPSSNVVNVTQAPYNADNTGTSNVTSIIQEALDDVGSAGGGVVFLPAGTYKVEPPSGKRYALHIKHSNVVLRGAGNTSTFIFNNSAVMREKEVIRMAPLETDVSWRGGSELNATLLTQDVDEMDTTISVASTSGLYAGNYVVLRADATSAWITEHGMEGQWDSSIGGTTMYRRVESVDSANKRITIDIPARYWLRSEMMRDYTKWRIRTTPAMCCRRSRTAGSKTLQ